jgi:hypothetical protein
MQARPPWVTEYTQTSRRVRIGRRHGSCSEAAGAAPRDQQSSLGKMKLQVGSTGHKCQ